MDHNRKVIDYPTKNTFTMASYINVAEFLGLDGKFQNSIFERAWQQKESTDEVMSSVERILTKLANDLQLYLLGEYFIAGNLIEEIVTVVLLHRISTIGELSNTEKAALREASRRLLHLPASIDVFTSSDSIDAYIIDLSLIMRTVTIKNYTYVLDLIDASPPTKSRIQISLNRRMRLARTELNPNEVVSAYALPSQRAFFDGAHLIATPEAIEAWKSRKCRIDTCLSTNLLDVRRAFHRGYEIFASTSTDRSKSADAATSSGFIRDIHELYCFDRPTPLIDVASACLNVVSRGVIEEPMIGAGKLQSIVQSDPNFFPTTEPSPTNVVESVVHFISHDAPIVCRESLQSSDSMTLQTSVPRSDGSPLIAKSSGLSSPPSLRPISPSTPNPESVGTIQDAFARHGCPISIDEVIFRSYAAQLDAASSLFSSLFEGKSTRKTASTCIDVVILFDDIERYASEFETTSLIDLFSSKRWPSLQEVNEKTRTPEDLTSA